MSLRPRSSCFHPGQGLVERANETEVFGDLNWWSAAHLEYAIRSRTSPDGALRKLQEDQKLLCSLTGLCKEEAHRVRQESKVFRERPLLVAAELQPWKNMSAKSSSSEGASVLIFGPGRHIRQALQQAGFQTTMWRRFVSGRCQAEAWPSNGPFEAAAMRYPDSSESFEFALHAVASQLLQGAPIWIYGDVREGVLSTTRAIRGLFSLKAIHEDADCRVISAIRSSGKAKDSFQEWLRQETVEFSFGSQEWWSVPGLFAGGQVDVMSQYLLDTMSMIKSTEEWPLANACSLLDFASGTGLLVAGVMRLLPVGHVSLLDADAAALEAASRNLPEASLLLADGFRCDLDGKFNLIVSNPPVHHGHADDLGLVLELLRAGPHCLDAGGEMWLVTQEHIPTGRLFEVAKEENERLQELDPKLESFYENVCMYPTRDGRFIVWRARCPEAKARKRKMQPDQDKMVSAVKRAKLKGCKNQCEQHTQVIQTECR